VYKVTASTFSLFFDKPMEGLWLIECSRLKQLVYYLMSSVS